MVKCNGQVKAPLAKTPQTYHSSYLNKNDHQPQFSQIYIHDANTQTVTRCGIFKIALNTNILLMLQELLHDNV